jgi:hypothetical protein
MYCPGASTKKHSKGLKTGTALILPAALADIIHKAGLYITGSPQRQQQGDEKDEAAGRAVRLR